MEESQDGDLVFDLRGVEPGNAQDVPCFLGTLVCQTNNAVEPPSSQALGLDVISSGFGLDDVYRQVENAGAESLERFVAVHDR